MTGAHELLDALREARHCTAVAGTGIDPDAVARQEASVTRLEQCLAQGLPKLGKADAEAVAAELKQLLLDNRFQMRWSQIRGQWARIGAPKSAPAPRRSVPRVDLVS